MPEGLEDIDLVDIDASLFTAQNDQLQEIKLEMACLRALSPQQSGPARTASRTRSGHPPRTLPTLPRRNVCAVTLERAP